MLVLIMEIRNIDMLNVFFVGYKNGFKGYINCGPLRPVRSLLTEMLFFMKRLCCEICLLMTLVTQVNINKECRWSYRLEQSLH